MTSFLDIEARSVAGSDINEDAFGSTSLSLVVVDGATGLGGERHTPFPSDAQWFSSRLVRAVGEHALRPITMRDVLSSAIADCARELNEMSVPAGADLPSASVVFARCSAEVLEILSLGDCTTVVSMVDESVEVIADDAVSGLDVGVVEAAVKIARRAGTTVRWAVQQLGDELRSNRALRNLPSGYWIADPTGVGVPHALVHRFPVGAVADVTLMTDGFAAVHAVTGQFSSWAGVARQLSEGEGPRMMSSLVEALEADQGWTRYPRLKARDDATYLRGIVGTVGKTRSG